MLTMLPFLPSFSHCLMARPLTMAGAVRFKAMTLSHIFLSWKMKVTSQLVGHISVPWTTVSRSYHLSHRIKPINSTSTVDHEIKPTKHLLAL
jgi:hypothetical protein